MTDDARLDFPATHRNRDAILEVLTPFLPSEGTVLEIASGSGQHLAYFAERLALSHPRLRFVPSDPDAEHRASARAWADAAELPSVAEPLAIDTRKAPWPIDRAQVVYCANMIHIAPWSACVGLVRGAAGLLPHGAPLVVYGPFMRAGQHTSASNAAFAERLRSRNPAWDVRDLDEVTALAVDAGFEPPTVLPMPANNFTVVYRRRSSS